MVRGQSGKDSLTGEMGQDERGGQIEREVEKSDERGQSRTAQVFDAVTGKPFITLYTNFKTMNTFLNCGRSNKNRS